MERCGRAERRGRTYYINVQRRQLSSPLPEPELSWSPLPEPELSSASSSPFPGPELSTSASASSSTFPGPEFALGPELSSISPSSSMPSTSSFSMPSASSSSSFTSSASTPSTSSSTRSSSASSPTPGVTPWHSGSSKCSGSSQFPEMSNGPSSEGDIVEVGVGLRVGLEPLANAVSPSAATTTIAPITQHDPKRVPHLYLPLVGPSDRRPNGRKRS